MRPEPGTTKSLPFIFVCDLLNELDDLVNREDYLLPRHLKERRNKAVLQWFGSHCRALEDCDKTTENVLAMLQPCERRKDCIYGFDTESLERTIARALHLPIAYLPELQKWRLGLPRMDLGACVENILSKYHNKLRTCPPAQAHKTSVYDINHALLIIACHHPESSANIRSLASHNLYSFDTELEVGKPFRFDAASTLCVLYRQLNGTQAKWLTRLLLKNFGPRKLFPDGLDLKATFRLPKCLEKFALPDREGPGLLSFKSILQRIDSTPPTSPMIASKLMAMSTPLGHLESKVTSAQASNLLPTPPMTNKKHVNALASISKKRKLTSSYPNANKRHLRISLSPPPLRHTQVSTPSSVPPKENKPMTQQLLATTQPSTKTVPTLAPTVIDLTNSQSVHGQHSDSIAITIQTDSSTCPQIVTSSLPISSKRAPAVFESSTSPAKCSKRQVLGSIDHNSQSQNTQVSATSSSCAKDSLQQKPPSKSKSNNSRIRRAGTGMCRLTQTTCQLVNFILLLSPCISDNPWITNSLLAWHGSRFTKSVRTFVHFTSSSQNSQTEKPTRKIILVNPQRTSQTVEFLKHVQKESSLSGGPKQRIDVYDWRLLEYMAKVDRGKEYTYDPWERCKMYTI